MTKTVTKVVALLSIGGLAAVGCASKEEKPAEGTKEGTTASCGAEGKPADGKAAEGSAPAGGSCGGAKK